MVGLSVASQIERALDLGIPLADLVGGRGVLCPDTGGTALARLPRHHRCQPTSRSAARDGRLRFVAGPRTGRFHPQGTIPVQPAAGGSEAPGTGAGVDTQLSPDAVAADVAPADHRDGARIGEKGALDRAIPLRLHGRVAGWLHIGINSSQFDRVTRDTAWDVLVVLVVALLTTVEILVFLTNQTITTPLRVIERLMVLITAEQWTARAVVERRDEPGRFLIQMNALVRRANELWLRVQWLAGEVGQGSPELRRRADELS